MNFLYDGTDNVEYEFIHRTIIDGNVINMSLIITEVRYVTIDANDYAFHGYYVITFSSFPYNLQLDFNIYGQVFIMVKLYVKNNMFLQLISMIIIIFSIN